MIYYAISLMLFFGSILTFFAATAILRSKDLFVLIQPLRIIVFYSTPILLLGFLLKDYSLSNLLKIAIIQIIFIASFIIFQDKILQKAQEEEIIADGKNVNIVKKKRKK